MPPKKQKGAQNSTTKEPCFCEGGEDKNTISSIKEWIAHKVENFNQKYIHNGYQTTKCTRTNEIVFSSPL